MFKFLKAKLKDAIASLSGKIDPEEAKEGKVEEKAEEAKGFFQKLKESITGPGELPAEKAAREKAEQEGELPEAAKPEEAEQPKLGAEEIENVIRDIDIHAPLPGEEEPEPVPPVEEETPPKVLPKKGGKGKKGAKEEEIIVEEYKPPQVVRELPQEEPERPAKPALVMAKALEEKPKVRAEIAKAEKSRAGPEPIKPGLPSTTISVKPVEEAKGFFGKIAQAFTTKKVSQEEFENLFWELEVALLENNVALQVIEKIKRDLAIALVDKPLPRGKVEELIAEALRQSLREVVSFEPIDIVAKAKEKKPFIICFVGVNGSGKTTTIAKMARLFMDNKMSVVLAAADTFRAAAIDQLELHGKRLGVKVVRHDYGADPAAVAFDAIKHAQAKNIDVVLIDTAGRLHSNINLVDEMKKIVRVANPDLKIFVGESITGNDCVEQAQQFDQAVGIDGIILAKADIDEKGGAAISVGYVTRKPILYIGTGQEYADLERFDAEKVLASLGL
jgi:fused signal recognition particle receptor